MTAVEFFDRAPIENVISSLTTVPDKIIYIGDRNIMKKSEGIIREFLTRRHLDIEVEFKNIKKNDINDIIAVLSNIVETEQDCVFDLTGGEDLVLVAMGIVFEKYAHKGVQMQRFNIRKAVVTDCDNDGNVLYSGVPEVTVAENIRIHGGVIRYEQDGDDRTYKWDLTEEFVADINKMWSICKVNPGLWNSQVDVLKECDKCAVVTDLHFSVNIPKLREHLKNEDIKFVSVKGLLKALKQKKLLDSYEDNGDDISFTYKDAQVKKCLEKAGTILEMKILITAKSVKTDQGENLFSDSMSGVCIDWDGDFHTQDDEKKDTENEIDVILMNGLNPIFISCKNGRIYEDELYKLGTVTDRFGGSYARKVLIATYLGKKKDSLASFEQRARDMKIKVITGVHSMTDEQLAKEIKHLAYS